MPLGSTYNIEYAAAGKTQNNPNFAYVLSKVSLHDGFDGDGVSNYVSTFEYANGIYDTIGNTHI